MVLKERRLVMTVKELKNKYKDYVLLDEVVEFSIEEDDNKYLWEGYCDEIDVDCKEADEIVLLVVGFKSNKLKLND